MNREPWQLRPRLKPHIVVGSKCDQAFCVCFQREARFERLRIDMATDLRPPGTRPERPKRGEEVLTPSPRLNSVFLRIPRSAASPLRFDACFRKIALGSDVYKRQVRRFPITPGHDPAAFRSEGGGPPKREGVRASRALRCIIWWKSVRSGAVRLDGGARRDEDEGRAGEMCIRDRGTTTCARG